MPRARNVTPDHLVLALLAAESLLWLSDLLGWPAWPKGYAVLAAVASAGVAMLLMLAWWLASLMFRWRFQFGIRALLVLVVAVAVPCSWMAVESRIARRQRDVRNAFTAQHCRVFYGSGGIPSVPAWLRALLGGDFFDDVVWAIVPPTRGDAAAATAMGLDGLRKLDLAFSHVTDAGLESLKGADQLHHLRLTGTQVTDAGLAHLESLRGLQLLELDSTKVTEEGVKKLQQALPKCQIDWKPPTRDERQRLAVPDRPDG